MSTPTILFWLSVLYVFYTVAGYPLLTFVLARIVNRKKVQTPIEPTVSLIIAAYNEEQVIADKIENTLALDYPKDKLEIVVASDGSTDRTDEIVQRYSDRGVRLIRAEGRIGKSATMNEVVPQTTGEILLFSDSTTVYEPDVVRHMISNFADDGIGAVSGHLVFTYENSGMDTGMKMHHTLSVRLRINENRFGGITHVIGAIHAIRRSCFEPCPPPVSPELWHVLKLARRRLRVVYEPNAQGHEVARSKVSSEFQARVRIYQQVFAFLGLLLREGPWRLSPMYLFQLFSHRATRWLLPIPLAVLMITSLMLTAGSPAFIVIAIALAALCLAGVFSLLIPRLAARIPGLSCLSYLTVFLVALTIGAVKSVFVGSQAAWHTDRDDEKVLFDSN